METERLNTKDLGAGVTFDWSCETEFPQIARALGYWNKLRGDRAMPARREIVPSDIQDILPFVQLYDVFDGGRAYRVRLLGTQIARLFPVDPTGQTFDASAQHPLVARMIAVFRRTAARKMPMIARAHRTTIDSISFAPIESIYLPLSDTGAKVDVVLSATAVPNLVEMVAAP